MILDTVPEAKARSRPGRFPAFALSRRSSATSPLWWSQCRRPAICPGGQEGRTGADRGVTVFDVTKAKACRRARSPSPSRCGSSRKDKTLTDVEIEALAEKIVAAALKLGRAGETLAARPPQSRQRTAQTSTSGGTHGSAVRSRHRRRQLCGPGLRPQRRPARPESRRAGRQADPGPRVRTTGIVVKEASDEFDLPARRCARCLACACMRRKPRGRLSAPGYFFQATDMPGVMSWMAEEAARAGATLLYGRKFEGGWNTNAAWRWPISTPGS